MANKELVYNSDIPYGQKALALLICSAQEYQSRINLKLKVHSLSLTQLSILHILDEMPQPHLTVGELKSTMIEDSPNVSRALKKLQEKEFIIKERDHTDQRIVYISITPNGKVMHEKCDNELSDIEINLNDDESQALSQLLLKI